MRVGCGEHKPLIILGTGVLSRLAASYFRSAGRVIAAYTEEEPQPRPDHALDAPVVPLAGLVQTHPPRDYELFVAVGNRDLNAVRQRLITLARSLGYTLASFTHPTACVSPEAVIGGNCLVLEHCTVGPFATVGEGSLLFACSLVNHDCSLGSCCYLSAAVLGGFVHIGERSFLGINAIVRDSVHIGSDCLIGAGALVLNNVPPETFIKAQASPMRPLLREKAFQFGAQISGQENGGAQR